MNEKIINLILTVIFLLITSIVFTEDFDSLIEKYLINQRNIKTLIAKGSMSINILDKNGTDTNKSSITIYMKSPDLFKYI